jgi:hypothetical protein
LAQVGIPKTRDSRVRCGSGVPPLFLVKKDLFLLSSIPDIATDPSPSPP